MTTIKISISNIYNDGESFWNIAKRVHENLCKICAEKDYSSNCSLEINSDKISIRNLCADVHNQFHNNAICTDVELWINSVDVKNTDTKLMYEKSGVLQLEITPKTLERLNWEIIKGLCENAGEYYYDKHRVFYIAKRFFKASPAQWQNCLRVGGSESKSRKNTAFEILMYGGTEPSETADFDRYISHVVRNGCKTHVGIIQLTAPKHSVKKLDDLVSEIKESKTSRCLIEICGKEVRMYSSR